MLTRKRFQVPVKTGNVAKDLDNFKRALNDYFLSLEKPDALQITEASVNTTPVGDSDPSTGAFTTLSASGLISANGGQIKFPATQNASADANTLDDYEEGTWTPTVTAQTGTFTTVSATGRYTKIGRVVFWNSRITITTNGTAATGMVITLPFTAAQPHVGAGREVWSIGTWVGVIGGGGSNTVLIYKYDSTYPGADNTIFDVSGRFEV